MLTMTTDENGIAVVLIDMPGRSMNVIDWALRDALEQAFAALAADDAVRGIVLGSAKSSFVAGADLAIMVDFVGEGTTVETATDLIWPMSALMRQIETCGKPVVVAAPGTALGGGLELMLAGHYRIAAANPKARFGLPEVTLGILPGAGGTQRLPRLIGIAAALPLLTEGRHVTAEEALDLGIVDRIVEPDRLIDEAKAAILSGVVNPVAPWDEKTFRAPGMAIGASFDFFAAANIAIAERTRGNYPAPRVIASCVYEGMRLPIDKALKIEGQYFGELVHSEVAQALIATAFFGRQQVAKAGRLPADVDGSYGRALKAALAASLARLESDGYGGNFLRNAARLAGLSPEMPADAAVVDPPQARGTPAELAPVGERLLMEVAQAARESLEAGTVPDATTGNVWAIETGCYPAYTGGPFHLLEKRTAQDTGT